MHTGKDSPTKKKMKENDKMDGFMRKPDVSVKTTMKDAVMVKSGKMDEFMRKPGVLVKTTMENVGGMKENWIAKLTAMIATAVLAIGTLFQNLYRICNFFRKSTMIQLLLVTMILSIKAADDEIILKMIIKKDEWEWLKM